MFHLFVCQNATYAAKIGGGTIADFNEVNLLQAGAGAFFDMSGTKMTTTTTLTGQNKFYFALGTGDAIRGARISIVMPRDIYSRSDKTYVAGTLQVDVVGRGTVGGANLPATLIPQSVAGILIVDGNAPVNNIVSKKYRYEYSVKAGDDAAAVLSGLVALINADPNSLVTATTNNTPVTGVTLTAKIKNQAFVTSVGSSGQTDILLNATVQTGIDTDSIQIVYTCGTPADIQEVEQVYSATEGNTNQLWLPQLYWKYPSLINSSSTYDLIDLQFELDTENAVGRYPATRQNVSLALVSGSAQVTSIKTILSILFIPTTLV